MLAFLLIIAIAFGQDLARENLRLKQANKALLKALRSLASESSVGALEEPGKSMCTTDADCPLKDFCSASASGQNYCSKGEYNLEEEKSWVGESSVGALEEPEK